MTLALSSSADDMSKLKQSPRYRIARRELTKPRGRQKLGIACQNHEQVKDVPGIAEICPRATAGTSPQQQLDCKECIEAQLCNKKVIVRPQLCVDVNI